MFDILELSAASFALLLLITGIVLGIVEKRRK